MIVTQLFRNVTDFFPEHRNSMATKSKKKANKPPQPESVPSEIRIIEAEGESDFRLIEAAEESPALRRFTMTAYTGGKLFLANFPFPVVVDLSGLRISAKSRPILRDHDASKIVGHTESIEIGAGSIKLAGVISAANQFAQEVADSSTNGFPWQASIGAQSEKVAFVDEGESVEVNGRKFTGPLYVARRAVLREVSFVALGADDQTTARVAANHNNQKPSSEIGVSSMGFDAWLEAMGFQADDLDETQTASLQAMYEASQRPGEPVSDPKPEVTAGSPPPAIADPIDPPPDPIDELRAKWAQERRRIQKIGEICAGQHPEIEAQAIEEGWDETKTELAVLRASRPKAPAVGSSTPPLTAKTLEAAACLSAGIAGDDLVREFGERTLDAAHPLRHMGLKELVAECARLEGYQIPRVFGDGQETIRAGFSTISLPGILESVMNRTMLAAYQQTPIAAFELCSIGSVSDFKEVSRYRLLGTGGFEKVAPDGELKHGKLSESAYKNKADTYGQILMLTRHDIINDDLDAFLDITRQMGRSGAESIDDLFFMLLLSNPNNFFSVGNGNY